MGEFMKKVVFVLIIILVLIGVFVYKDDKVDKMLKEEYTSKYKINDLYNSKEIAYRSLSSDEAKIYDKIINEIINFNSKITINLSKYNYNNPYLNFNKLEEIIDAISIDHPELIYFGYPSLNVNGNSNKVNITIHYVMDENTYKNSINLIKDEIDKIKVSTKDMDEYEKIKYVYEYLGFKNNYGKINDPMAQSAYSAFDSKYSPVCAGYAKASELIFNNIGVTSLLTIGELKTGLFASGSHAWNIVKIKNKYYNYDVTQSSGLKKDNNISHMGLLSIKKKNFVILYKNIVPNISYGYDYYKLNNLEFSTKDLYKLKDNNDKYIELRIKDITRFKLEFNNMKDELGIKNYRYNSDIVLLERN